MSRLGCVNNSQHVFFPLPFSGGPSFIIGRQSKSMVPLDGENLDTQTNEDEENHKPTNHP